MFLVFKLLLNISNENNKPDLSCKKFVNEKQSLLIISRVKRFD